jgi:hypothetical protein
MENLGIFYDHLVYFTAIGNILWSFGISCGNLVYFSPFGHFGPRKIWQPCAQSGTNVAYDHNFLRFCQFLAKQMCVFLKNQCYDQIFAKKLAVV